MVSVDVKHHRVYLLTYDFGFLLHYEPVVKARD